jgi:hypothetical protein
MHEITEAGIVEQGHLTAEGFGEDYGVVQRDCAD